MILKKTILDLFNKQYTAEIKSALIYWNIAGFYEDRYFSGIAKFFHKKYEEEMQHAEKFYQYICSRDGKPVINPVDLNNDILCTETTNLINPFYTALKHEQFVSEAINNIFAECRKENDFSSEEFLHYFINEQIEEESEFLNLIAQLELIKGSKSGWYSFDRQLGGN